MDHFLDQAQIIELISAYGYWAIFVVVSLESAGLPLPGETMLVGAAIYSGQTGALSIEDIIFAAGGGAIAGDNIGYWLGREYGSSLLERYGPWIGVTPKKLRLGQYLFLRWGGWIVFIGRFVTLLRMLAGPLAGANRLPPAQFFIFNAAGGVIWAHIFGLGGYYLTSAFQLVEGRLAFIMFIIVFVGLAWLWRYFRLHEERLIDEAEAALAEKSAELPL
jgi:membrane protein DedA with SNARE-associated domain